MITIQPSNGSLSAKVSTDWKNCLYLKSFMYKTTKRNLSLQFPILHTYRCKVFLVYLTNIFRDERKKKIKLSCKLIKYSSLCTTKPMADVQSCSRWGHVVVQSQW